MLERRIGRPSGTVTFLFTDIEGSTGLWEKHGEKMRVALARHDEILIRESGSRWWERHTSTFKAVQEELGPEAFRSAFEAGRSLTLEQIVGLALDTD